MWDSLKELWESIKTLDRLLRGEGTRLTDLREGTIPVPVLPISKVVIILGMVYGLCMGFYGAFGTEDPRYMQLLASTVKVPTLFFLTLVVTFPSLYVFNALVGSRLTVLTLLQLLVGSLAVNLAVLASLGPVVAFFSFNTTSASYPFMVVLNVLVFTLSGVLGLTFLLQTLHRLTIARSAFRPPRPEAPPRASSAEDEEQEPVEIEMEMVREPGPLDRLEGHVLGKHVKKVFVCWMFLFAVVGSQMGWVLRPFIGYPGQKFEWFRARESNFFEAVLESLNALFS